MNLLSYAELCKFSYDNSYPTLLEKDDLRCVSRRIDGKFVIAVRGTANFENLIRDIRVLPPTKTPTGHWGPRGFVLGFRKLEFSILELLKDVNEEVEFTGHSLGGRIAGYFAEALKCTSITFGAPSGYFRFGKLPQIDHFRVVADDDPVPNIPGLLFKDKRADLVLYDTDQELFDVKDHSITYYIRLIKRKEYLCSTQSENSPRVSFGM